VTRLFRFLALFAVLESGPRLQAAQGPEALAARAAEGSAAMQASRFDAAATIYAELVAARPGDAGLLMNLGMARYMAGHPADALAPLQKAVRLNPALAPGVAVPRRIAVGPRSSERGRAAAAEGGDGDAGQR
jgi:predicted Zn-dependent protease